MDALLDAQALESDLAAVMRRLPASSRYGARDGAGGLVTGGMMQALYARVGKLQALLRRKESDARAATARANALQAQLDAAAATQASLDTRLLESARALAAREQALLEASQRARDAERRALLAGGGGAGGADAAAAGLQRALEEAHAQLTARDSELAQARARLTERDAELREAERVLRASEAELAGQLATAASNLMPLVAGGAPGATNKSGSAGGDAQTRIRELEAEVLHLKSSLASAVQARGTATAANSAEYLAATTTTTTTTSSNSSTASVATLTAELAAVRAELAAERTAKARITETAEKLKSDAAAARSEAERLAREADFFRAPGGSPRSAIPTPIGAVPLHRPSDTGSTLQLPTAHLPELGELVVEVGSTAFVPRASYNGGMTPPSGAATPTHGGSAASALIVSQLRDALTKERADRQALQGQLEVVRAEAASLRTSHQKSAATRTQEVSEAAHKAQALESQLRDAQRRLAAAESRLLEVGHEARAQRAGEPAASAELDAERESARMLRLQVSTLAGSLDILQRQLAACRADLRLARDQQLADSLAAQHLSRQVEELGSDAARRLRDAESAADALARAHLERLMELRNHRALLDVCSSAVPGGGGFAHGGSAYTYDGLVSGVEQPATPPAGSGGSREGSSASQGGVPSAVAGAQQHQQPRASHLSAGSGSVAPASSVHPAELDGHVEWHSGLPLLERHLQLDSAGSAVAPAPGRTSVAGSGGYRDDLRTASSLGDGLPAAAVPAAAGDEGGYESYLTDNFSEQGTLNAHHHHQQEQEQQVHLQFPQLPLQPAAGFQQQQQGEQSASPSQRASRTTVSDSFAFSSAGGSTADQPTAATAINHSRAPHPTMMRLYDTQPLPAALAGGYNAGAGGYEQYSQEVQYDQQYMHQEQQYSHHHQHHQQQQQEEGLVVMGRLTGDSSTGGDFDAGVLAARLNGLSHEAPL